MHSMVQWLQLKVTKFQQTISLWTSHKMGYVNFNAILTELHITLSNMGKKGVTSLQKNSISSHEQLFNR